MNKFIFYLLLSSALGMTFTPPVKAMEENSAAKREAQIKLERLRDTIYNQDRDHETRQGAAITLNAILSSGTINPGDKVPRRNYTFSQLIDEVANRYRLVKRGKWYGTPQFSESRPSKK